jgi:aspartate aminotransferase
MIPHSIQTLLQPLEDFEALRRRAVRLGDRLCDLSYANPYAGAQFGAAAALEEALHKQRLLGLQYSPFGGHTLPRRLVADSLRSSHVLPFTYRDIVLTPGAMSALQIALFATIDGGDEVVIPTPCWLDHPLYVLHTRGVPVTVPSTGAKLALDIEAIAASITARTRAIILTNPSNPIGWSYDQATLATLGEAVAHRERELGIRITIIADETHRDFTDPGTYESPAQHFSRTIIVYSFGKYHFIQGQRLGYAAVSPSHPERQALGSELERWTRVTGIATPTALMQQAIPRLLDLKYDQSWLNIWRRRVVERLTEAGYEVVRPNSTLFVYVRTPRGFSDSEFVSLLAERGVLVLPAQVFHHNGYIRLALTGSEDMLERALATFEEMETLCLA